MAAQVLADDRLAQQMPKTKTGVTAQRNADMNNQQITAEALVRQTQAMEQLANVMMEMNRPRTKVPVRDENGLIVGVREVYEDAA